MTGIIPGGPIYNYQEFIIKKIERMKFLEKWCKKLSRTEGQIGGAPAYSMRQI